MMTTGGGKDIHDCHFILSIQCVGLSTPAHAKLYMITILSSSCILGSAFAVAPPVV